MKTICAVSRSRAQNPSPYCFWWWLLWRVLSSGSIFNSPWLYFCHSSETSPVTELSEYYCTIHIQGKNLNRLIPSGTQLKYIIDTKIYLSDNFTKEHTFFDVSIAISHEIKKLLSSEYVICVKTTPFSYFFNTM